MLTQTVPFRVPADHPCLPGHFPGHPIVPGVVVLDAVARALRALLPGARITGVTTAKFSTPLLPGQAATLHIDADPGSGKARFRCAVGERTATQGEFAFALPSP